MKRYSVFSVTKCEPLIDRMEKAGDLEGKLKNIAEMVIFRAERVAFAVAFYEKYHDSYEQFVKDFPEKVKNKKDPDLYWATNPPNFGSDDERRNVFNWWLFRYTFQDVF